jgi:hypothetical protein
MSAPPAQPKPTDPTEEIDDPGEESDDYDAEFDVCSICLSKPQAD